MKDGEFKDLVKEVYKNQNRGILLEYYIALFKHMDFLN